MGWLAQPSGGNLLLEDGTKIKKETGKKFQTKERCYVQSKSARQTLPEVV